MLGSRPYSRIGDREAARFRDEAALGIVEAQISCLRRRRAAAEDGADAHDLACQMRDAAAARRALLARNGLSEPA
jgi:hypothetical protein